MGGGNHTDCETHVPDPYTGPVPIVTHLHGAHVDPHSDGYPEAWWLPGANDIPAGYATTGSVYTQADYANVDSGSAYYMYRNDQPATTLWFHDHTIGMTRLNVYAGPAGFWLLRGGANDTAAGVLPGPAPVAYNPADGPAAINDPNFNADYRNTIREIPIVIQDRAFDWAAADGTVLPDATGATQAKLFYPDDRVFFDGFNGPYIGNPEDGVLDYVMGTGPVDATTGRPLGNSDISGIWNPEAFFNTIVVNGTTWPKLDVDDSRYRFRLLNGCNSRALNLAMYTVTDGGDGIWGNGNDVLGTEVPFYQIGGDQGFLPNVVKITTGFATVYPGDGSVPADTPVSSADKALLLMNAERGDVIVDFSGMANGTRIRMINTAPDAPFGGFPDVPADALTSGQVMDFVVDTTIGATDTSTPVEDLNLPAEVPLGPADNTRPLSLNELGSEQVCFNIDSVTEEITTLFSRPEGDSTFLADCLATTPLNPGDTVEEAGPRQARMGLLIPNGSGGWTPVSKLWGDPVTEMPVLDSTEIWEFHNDTADAHPVHIHLVGFEIIDRQDLDAVTLNPVGEPIPPEPNELGFKDTVISYPGQVVRVKAKFDIPGLYVWHCHILEHEDNEMMRPFTVLDAGTLGTPNGGESLTGLSNFDVSWTAMPGADKHILYYSTTSGASWSWVATVGAASSSGGTYSWTVPNIDTSTAQFRVVFYSGGTWMGHDVSDADFSISSVTLGGTLTSPNGGESYEGLSTQTATWSPRLGANKHILYYSPTGGAPWTWVATLGDVTSHNWDIPNEATTTAAFRVAFYNGTTWLGQDVSNAPFTITAAPIPGAVVSPNGPGTLTIGTTVPTSWNAVQGATKYRLYYSTTGGAPWTYIATSTVAGYSWLIPNDPTATARFRVSAFNGSTWMGTDISDNDFTISP